MRGTGGEGEGGREGGKYGGREREGGIYGGREGGREGEIGERVRYVHSKRRFP